MDIGSLPRDLEVTGEPEPEPTLVHEGELEVTPGPRLRKGGTCVEEYVLIGSKQWVEEGGEGRYEGEPKGALEVEVVLRGV